MQTNLRFGCVILRHYLDIERGDLFLALGRYNGSRGRTPYPGRGVRRSKGLAAVANCRQRCRLKPKDGSGPTLLPIRSRRHKPDQRRGDASSTPSRPSTRSTVSSTSSSIDCGR